MNKIFYILSILLLLGNILFPQTGWVLQSSGTTEKLNKVSLFNKKIGCIVGNSGTILHTTNGGVTWEKQFSGIRYNLYNLTFLDSLTIIAIGDSGTILRTSNGGENWVKQTSSLTSNFRGISFLNKKFGFVVGGLNGVASILFTSDKGLTWDIKSINEINFIPIFIHYKDTSNIILLGVSRGDVISALSSDGGKTWSTNYLNVVAPQIHFSDASFANSQIGYLAGYGVITSQYYPFIYKTTDGGASWRVIPKSGEFGINGICGVNTNIITFIGWGWDGSIHRSTDGGEIFTVQFSRTKEILNSVSFVDSLTGSIVGYNGIILHTTNGGIITKSDSTISQPNIYNLKQNYPNPFNPTTTIEYSIPERTNVTLKIFDVLGREITTLVNEEKSAGNYKVEFSGTSLPSGIYFYQFSTGNYIETKKMILIK